MSVKALWGAVSQMRVLSTASKGRQARVRRIVRTTLF
jgi:hypothetical protein